MSISKFFNKTFFRIAAMIALLACVGLLFAGCGLGRLHSGPDASDVVSGNGTLAVQKGDYLYFVNGYKNTSDVGESNNYGSVDQSAIYRAKLTPEGRVSLPEPKLDDEGEEIFDETQALQDLDILVPKVAGFEYTKLFIFGDYLYYATPNHLKDGAGKVMSDYLHIYRVRLDRDGGNDLVYSTDATASNVHWTMHQIEDVVYMTILDEHKLVVINIEGSNFGANTVAEDVSSASLPVYRSSATSVKDIDKSIYFAQSVEDDDTTTVLKKYSLADKVTTEVFNSEGVKYDIKNTSGNKLYYTKTVSVQPGFSAKVYAMSPNAQEVQVSSQTVGSASDIQNYALVDAMQGTGILYTDGTSSYFKLADNATATKFLSSNMVGNIVSVQGDFVYYMADSTLYKVNYTLANQTGIKVIPEGVTPKGDIVNNFSVNGDKAYFFVKYTNNYYLHYVDYGATMAENDLSVYTHFVGKLLPEDYVSESGSDE